MSGDERWAGEVGVSERGGVSVSGRGGVLVSGYDGGGGVSWWVIEGRVHEDRVEEVVCGHDRGGGVSWWGIESGVDEDGVEGGCGYKRGGGDSWWVTVRLVPFACSRSPTLVLVHLPSLILVCVLFAKVGEVR